MFRPSLLEREHAESGAGVLLARVLSNSSGLNWTSRDRMRGTAQTAYRGSHGVKDS